MSIRNAFDPVAAVAIRAVQFVTRHKLILSVVGQVLLVVVGVTYLEDSAIKISIKPWVSVADFIPAAGELNAAIVLAFRANKLEIPFPQCEVRLLPGSAGSAP